MSEHVVDPWCELCGEPVERCQCAQVAQRRPGLHINSRGSRRDERGLNDEDHIVGAIVAWMREGALITEDHPGANDLSRAAVQAIRMLADAIERGDWKAPPP